jgi:glycosyltransferase involved in cell wall biosynthesis
VKLLFLHEVNYIDKPIFEMHEFPELLAAKGHEVGFLHFPEGWSCERIRRAGFRANISGRVVPNARLILYTPQNASGNLIGRLWTALTFSRTFRRVIRDFQPDLIVSFAVPTSGWQAIRVAKGQSIPYVFRALDVSHKIRKSTFSLLIRFVEEYIFRHADLISSNNPAMADYCISRGAPRNRVSVNFPPLNLSHFLKAADFRRDYRTKLGIPLDCKVLVYMGSFFYFSGLPEVISEFVKSAGPDTLLLLIGGGEQDEQLRGLVEKLGIGDRVLFTGFVHFSELPAYLGVADVAINSMQASLVSNAAFPNKVIQYMASSLPVVSTNLEGLRKTFGELEGILFAPSPHEVVREACRLVMQSDLARIGKLNREAVAQQFSSDRAVFEFESLLKTLVISND